MSVSANIAVMPQDTQKRREYTQSDEGKATRKAYHQSDKAKAIKKAYVQSDKGKATNKAYERSDKAKAVREAYRQSDEGKACRQKHEKAHRAVITAKSRSRPAGHDLYIMKIPNHANWYKVGRAADPCHRAYNLSAGYPWNVEIVKVYDGCGKYEKTVHHKLEPFMISGENKKLTEWFEIPEDELIKQIDDILIVELF